MSVSISDSGDSNLLPLMKRKDAGLNDNDNGYCRRCRCCFWGVDRICYLLWIQMRSKIHLATNNGFQISFLELEILQ